MVCANCGSAFVAKQSQQRYCQRPCYLRAKRKRQAPRQTIRKRDSGYNAKRLRARHRRRITGKAVPVPYAQCLVCRALHVIHPAQAKIRQHCRPIRRAACHPDRKHDRQGLCYDCFLASRRKPVRTGECPECGSTFRMKVSHQQFCGTECNRRNRKRRDKARRRALMRSAFVEDVDNRTVFERDGWICQLCFQPVPQDIEVNDPWAATIDHITPLGGIHGGTHEYSNVQLAHRDCNSRKRDRVGWTWTEAEGNKAA